jgi:hypothetical protein
VCATLMEARASAAGDIQDLRCAGRWPCAGACCGWRLRCLLSGDGRGPYKGIMSVKSDKGETITPALICAGGLPALWHTCPASGVARRCLSRSATYIRHL